MPEYVLELWVRNDKLKRGGGRNGATFQTTRTNKRAGQVATWTFYSTDAGTVVRDALETTVAATAAAAFVD